MLGVVMELYTFLFYHKDLSGVQYVASCVLCVASYVLRVTRFGLWLWVYGLDVPGCVLRVSSCMNHFTSYTFLMFIEFVEFIDCVM